MEVVRTKARDQSTNWVFTLNNYSDDELASLAILCDEEHPFELSASRVAALACSEEVGLRGTPHLQGYLQLTKKGISPRSLVSRTPKFLSMIFR